MKKITFTVAIVFFAGMFLNGYSWSLLNSGTTNQLYDICFVNDSTGFVIGSYGTILKTTNSGKNWIPQNSGTIDVLRSVFFINPLVGYTVGGTTNTSVLLKTTDGGINWNIQNTGINKVLYSVYFTSVDTGYAVGYQGVIIKTTDGGISWNSLPNVSNLSWYSVRFFNSNEGIVVGRNGKIIKTTDGGLNWSIIPVSISTSSILWNIQFINSQTGFIASTSGGLLKTIDGGNSWNVLNTASIGNNFRDVFFINDTIGYVAGGGINKTINGGVSWTKQYDAEGIGGTVLFFTNSLVGYAVGGYSSSTGQGAILKTNIGGGYTNFDYADGNNIKARFNIGGSMFWDMIQNADYEIPKGSGHMSMFASNLWMGGKDQFGEIHLFGNGYHTMGFDLFPGPVMNNYYCEDEENWIRFWKMKRSEIEYHVTHWATPGYVMPVNISEWPGNGDTTKGMSHIIAPYYDFNGDGWYSPQQGDYPLIKGDEALFFVFNDSMRLHTESSGRKLGLEIHAMAYAFDCPGDSAFWNTLFLNYEIINRSQNTYDSVYFGFFSDFDLGDPNDDYVGCDVSRSSFYVYNGDEHDGDGQGITYGTHPPAQSVTFLGGPFMDADGSDYGSSGIADGCDESTNGLGFNDGVVDNEQLGMTNFMFFNNGSGAMGDPVTALEYYYYLTSRWKNGSHMMYGCMGHLSDSIPADFAYPGNTDICGLGTDGIPQPSWTEISCNNLSGDRRGAGSMGPFTMLPGSVHNADIAFVFGRDYVNPGNSASIAVMQQRIDSVRKGFKTQISPCGTFGIGIKENKLKEEISVFPNPANYYFDIKTENNTANKSVYIYTIEGVLVKESSFNGSQTRIYTDRLSNGLYIVEITSKNSIQFRKVVITK